MPALQTRSGFDDKSEPLFSYLKSVALKTCASSKVAITGGAIRRPSWHWRALSMFNRRMASYNRLTLGPAPSDRHKLYTSERDSQRIFSGSHPHHRVERVPISRRLST